MKKTLNTIIVVLVLIIYANSRLLSQELREHKLSIGVHGGPAGTIMYFVPIDIKGGEGQPALSYLAGLDLRYNLKPRIALAAEINYEQKGIMYYSTSFRNIYRTGYLTLPLSFNFRINAEDKKVQFYINAGIYFGYLINEMQVYKPINGEVGKYYYRDLSKEGRFDWGLVTGLGWKISIKEHFQFLIEVRNNLGLINLINPDPLFNNYSLKKRNESFAILFGLAYKI